MEHLMTTFEPPYKDAVSGHAFASGFFATFVQELIWFADCGVLQGFLGKRGR
jgi:hypothetical protein